MVNDDPNTYDLDKLEWIAAKIDTRELTLSSALICAVPSLTAEIRRLRAIVAESREKTRLAYTSTDTDTEGLFGKYIIAKADGTMVDPNADYFVLRLDTDRTARAAMRVYAEKVAAWNPDLARDLVEKLDRYDVAFANLQSRFEPWRFGSMRLDEETIASLERIALWEEEMLDG